MRSEYDVSTKSNDPAAAMSITVKTSDFMDVFGPLVAGALALAILGFWTRSRLSHADDAVAQTPSVAAIH